jgi:threonine dehydrogenase-like Zn-dependent dehydrogenase
VFCLAHAGPVGPIAAQSAWLMGAGRVIVVDHLVERREKARTMAYAETLNDDEYDDIVVGLKKQTDCLGAHVVIGERHSHVFRLTAVVAAVELDGAGAPVRVPGGAGKARSRDVA